MSWMSKRPQAGESVQFYSVGLNKTVLLVGLGNFGTEYALTRHNIGFEAIDAFVRDNNELASWVNKKDLKCYFTSGQLGQTRVICIKPTTFMNNSGESVQAVSSFYKIHPDNVVVLHDELDVDFGHIRLRVGGSSAGNNGIKSVSQHIGEDYGRIRIGIGPKTPAAIDSADFVLQTFSAAQQADLPAMARETGAILSEYIFGGELPHETRSFII